MRNKEKVHRFLHRGKPRKAKALHVICRGSLPSIMKKRTCSLFNDDQLSSIINMLASSWIKRFFHSRKSEEVLKSWTRNHMSLPLIREKVKRGAITENKQKDLTKSSSTLLVDEEAPSLLFFIFLSPLSLKSLFAGERFGMVQQHQQRDGWQAIDQASGKRPSKYVM